ncbi:MAG: hypothetical protein ACFFCW_46945 [Candidatus Hodarchaeota archaeon]
MNKAILFILYISLACCIGFIGGMFFGGFYNQDIVQKTVSEYDKFEKLMERYKLIIYDQLKLEDLEAINSIDDIASLKEKYRENGLTNIKLFREQANILKKNAPNPSPIVELENSVNEIEKVFKRKQP